MSRGRPVARLRLRPANPEDLAALLALQRAYYRDDRYPYDPRAARRAWRRLLPDSRLGRVFVCDDRGDLRGYAVLTLGYSLEHRGRDAFVDEIYVVPELRGHGLGSRLLAAIEVACRRLGVHALHLEVERDKREAQALYRKRGFRDRGRLLLTMPLPQRRDNRSHEEEA